MLNLVEMWKRGHFGIDVSAEMLQDGGMDVWESIILGIVEGLTEYLPVSSTGHLIITQYLLGLEKSEALDAFEICIQGGAILAVLGLYYPRVLQMWRGALGKDRAGLRLLVNMLIGFIPAAVVGLLCSRYIKEWLFHAPVVMVSWALGGIVILLYVRGRAKSGRGQGGKPLEELSARGALGVGVMQCVAMCPGVSRSLMTMLGGLTVGLSVSAAVEYSFLLGVITLGAATCYDAVKHGAAMVESIGWGPMIVGSIVAWLSALVAVKWMVGYLNRHSLAIFGWYRLAAACVMLALILHGFSFSSQMEPTPSAPTETCEQASEAQGGSHQGA